METRPRKIINILAARNDRFGEFLLNIPAFRALKQSYTGSKLVLAVNAHVKDIAECIDFVDELIVWENKRHSLSQILGFARDLKSRKFDLCVMFNPSKELNVASFLAGIPVRAGYSHKWSFLLNKKIQDKKYLADKHEIEYNLELAALIGANTRDSGLSLRIEEGLVDVLFHRFRINALDQLVALHPWTSDPVKQWPIKNFREIASRLSKELGMKVLVIGGQNESYKSSQLFGGLGENIVDFTGKTTLKQLAALLKRCRLLISGDSGPVHLASCVDIPVIAIFRNDLPGKTPARWGPRSRESIVIQKSSLPDISVSEVFEKAKEALAK